MRLFIQAVLWEFIQNLPLVVAFVAAVWLWARKRIAMAIVLAIAGSTVGSLIIRFTEPLIHNYHEPIAATITNIVAMSIMMLLFTLYLGSEAKWSSWKTDLILGGLAGVLLGVAQGLSTPGAPIVGVIAQTLIFGLVAAVVLIGIRTLKSRPLSVALGGGVLLTAAMTILISLISYSYFLFGLE
jgi:hypothetical protein